MIITATYSAEDNKLRLYASSRLDQETYNRVSQAGFKWAPVQELFVAPAWTPAREDLCIELAGEITAEDSTLVDRAEAKAARLDALAEKRARQANGYYNAANRLSERFYGGQPILVGHHSERGARRDQEKMHRAMDQAVKCKEAVKYWNYRAEGVERHANHKADPGVRARRIKTLLAELRDRQRDINHAFLCLKLWSKVQAETDQEQFEKLVDLYSGVHLKTGPAVSWSLADELRDGKITRTEFVTKAIDACHRTANSEFTSRWINHILNRLAYERSELGPVARFDGELTATILQAFTREHGAHKPQATKKDDVWLISSSVPLPVHLINSETDPTEIILDDAGWRDLMQSVGYEVPVKKSTQPPLLNFKAAALVAECYGNVSLYPQIEMTKAEYSAICNDYKGTRASTCGKFRFRTCVDRKKGFAGGLVSVFLTDSKVHDAPESDAVRYEGQQSEVA